MQDNLLSIELLIDHNIQVVLLLLDIDWNINTSTRHFDWNWLSVILILEEEGEVLAYCCQLKGHKSELDLSA